MIGKRIRFAICTLIVSAILIVQTGCGFKDIDKRFFVVTIGVDKSVKPNANYRVELKLAISTSEEKFGSNRYIIVTEDSDTITEAVRIMKSKVDKELDFGHAKAIVFGESLIKENLALNEIMDWFIRRRDIQMISWMAIGRPDAITILKMNPKSERLPANIIFLSFGQTGTNTAFIVSEYLFDLRRRMKERGLDPILPIIEQRAQDQIQINKLAVFTKERLVLELGSEETKIFNMFYRNIGKTDVKVNDEDLQFVISMDTIRTKLSVKKALPNGELPSAEITIQMKGIIEESRQPINLNDLKKYERLAEKEVSDRVKATVQRLQKAGADPIGIGLKYRSTHMSEQADWESWSTQ